MDNVLHILTMNTKKNAYFAMYLNENLNIKTIDSTIYYFVDNI